MKLARCSPDHHEQHQPNPVPLPMHLHARHQLQQFTLPFLSGLTSPVISGPFLQVEQVEQDWHVQPAQRDLQVEQLQLLDGNGLL